MVEERGAVEGKKPVVAEFKAELAREIKALGVEETGIMTVVKEPPKSLKHLHASKEASVAGQMFKDEHDVLEKAEEIHLEELATSRMLDRLVSAAGRGKLDEVKRTTNEATARAEDWLERMPEEKLSLKDLEFRERVKTLKNENEMLAFLKDFTIAHPHVMSDIFRRVAPELYYESLREVRAERMREQTLAAIRMNELTRSNVMELAMFSVSSVIKKSEDEKEESANIAEMKAREEEKEKEIERESNELVQLVTNAIAEQIKNLNTALSENAKTMLAAEVLMHVAKPENCANYVGEGELKKNAVVAAVNERISAILGIA